MFNCESHSKTSCTPALDVAGVSFGFWTHSNVTGAILLLIKILVGIFRAGYNVPDGTATLAILAEYEYRSTSTMRVLVSILPGRWG